MQITRQADYATRAILYLARNRNGQRVATNQVAKEQKIPSSFLAKIISQLSIAGLLHTSRGARGGITLARDPEQITLLQVIEAIDGPIQLNVCVECEGLCSFEDKCPIQTVWRDTQKELISKLRNTNFAQLIA
ncbi:MAG TPA: Rrf2 family transcriptional regulator [Anaerolineales bacterium]|nr:Rrf2 family transcriptional regulator [Anaerolineales bacterium]